MTSKQRANAIVLTLRLLVILPIWFWMTYQVLLRVNASELMMFLFWCYVPLHLLAMLIAAFGGLDSASNRDEGGR